MSDAPATLINPADDTAAVPDRSRTLIERQLDILGRLAEVGLEVAIEVERRLKADASIEPQGAAMAYARAARAVRMTLLLQSRLIKELQAFEAEAAPEDALRETAEDDMRSERRDEHKRRVERVVHRVAKAAIGDEDEVEQLVYEAGERLDDDDVYGEVLDRPVGELVALICRDLGLDPDWSRLAEEAWAKAEVADGDPRSPFAAIGRTRPPPLAGEVAQRAGGGIPPPRSSNCELDPALRRNAPSVIP